MIHIFCALRCEAQPIIQYFKLTELKQHNLFRLYQSNDKQITLTITGIGKLNAACAVSYHHACLNTSKADIWLNIGIAGHANIAVGDIRLVNKITDQHDHSNGYPQIIFRAPCKTTNLITLDRASTKYQAYLFDMEASGFYQMAIRLGSAELIHCLKIVSDNIEQSTLTVNAAKVKKMMTAQLQTITKLIERLKPLSKEIRAINSKPDYYQSLIEKWHFTETEKTQLLRLLRQCAVRFPDEDIMPIIADNKTGKSVLRTLSEKIKDMEFVIYD